MYKLYKQLVVIIVCSQILKKRKALEYRMRRRTKYKEDYMQYIEVSYFDKLPGNLNESLFVSLSVYLVLEQEKIFQLQLGRLTLIKNIYY